MKYSTTYSTIVFIHRSYIDFVQLFIIVTDSILVNLDLVLE